MPQPGQDEQDHRTETMSKSDTSAPQQGAAPAPKPQQQGQSAPQAPQQGQPIIRDWASI